MKPQRPDSAKSVKTRITIDSEISTNNLNTSKFSQTFSQGVKVNNDKNNDFHKYVSEKNKDPKFKKFLQTNLPQIPEQLKPSTQLSKLTSKPFERKTSKIDKEKSQRKVEEVQKKIQQQPKVIKKENLQSSKTFIDKSKQKLKLQSKQETEELQTNSRIQQKNLNTQKQPKQNSNGNKPKINLNGFVLNVPGKAPQIIKQQKAQQKSQENKQNQQKRQRQKIMTEISQFVSQIQQRNVDYLPNRYDQFIDKNMDNKDFDIEKININDFLQEPNQKDYSNLMRKINQNQRKLQNNQKKVRNLKSNSSMSINLQQIIDESASKKQEQQDKADDTSVIMSSMTASDVKDRNMFLTQILKGRRLTENQLCQIKQNNDAMIKLIKLQDNNKDDYLNDDQIQITQINMTKKKNHRIIQRNKIQAAGDYYRQCDYLTPEQQKRIQDLINGAAIQSPFQFTQMQAITNRRIDEGIKIHRKLCKDIQGTQFEEQDIRIQEQALPKDPILRKKAQLKILRQKINSVNARLCNLNQVVVSKNKLQTLMNKYKQTVRPSKMSESIINQKNKQIEGQCQRLRQAQQILTKAESQKQQIIQTLQDLNNQFSNMYQDIIRIQNMDVEQLRIMQQKKLNEKKKQIQKVQKQAKQFQSQLDTILEASQQLKKKMDVLDKIITVKIQIPRCEGYQQGETIEDLDQLVTRKWQAAEQAVQNIRNQEC